MDPPATVEVAVQPKLDWTAMAQQSDEVVLFRKALYRRAVSPLDDGPLWQYLYDAEASHWPPPSTTPAEDPRSSS